jgi:uncharacterized protein YecE (DUF72 family)
VGDGEEIARPRPRIGTAGWAIRREHSSHYDPGPSHLARYATRFNAVEINSSFYRPHRRATYERWAASVPASFRFAVKAPKAITHTARCRECENLVDAFLDEIGGLGTNLGPVLFQFPPNFAFDKGVSTAFFSQVRDRFDGEVVCEPRHATWFAPEPEALLVRLRIAHSAADPPPARDADEPAGWRGLAYWRLHGSPRMYYSAYEPEYLARIAARLTQHPNAWCIFDNTARGAAVENALELRALVRGAGQPA